MEPKLKNRLKWRGKDEFTDEWNYGIILNDGALSYIVSPTNIKHYMFDSTMTCTLVREVKTDTVGQYSEFKDINDNEIYEADLVEVSNVCEKPIIMRVEYTIHGFRVINKTATKMFWLMSLLKSDLKIIGNIYDNLELFK